MIAGAHFRSDVYAGLLLGAAMITVFYQNPQFTGALADASVDLRRSLVHQRRPLFDGKRMAGVAPHLSIRSYR